MSSKHNHNESRKEDAPEGQAADAAQAPESAAPGQATPTTETAKPSEADILKDRLLRLQADFDNFRKRAARERAEWQLFALEQFIQELLPVVDHYELGLATAEKQQIDASVMGGFKLVYDQMMSVLKKQGLTQVSAKPGIPFDPHQQEAISHIASEEHPADVVIAETRRGYRLGEKMIRPLQVVVSSGPGKA